MFKIRKNQEFYTHKAKSQAPIVQHTVMLNDANFTEIGELPF